MSKVHARYLAVTALTVLGSVLVEALAPAGALGHYQWSAPALVTVTWLLHAIAKSGPTAGPPAAALVLLAALGLSSCSTLGPVPPPGTPGFVNCSDAALHAAALNILPSVENALATDGYEAALATIIASVGGPLALAEVECAVAWVLSKAEESAPATADSLEAAKAAHAKAWLAAHPVTFQ
jgi:hypothetical protein